MDCRRFNRFRWMVLGLACGAVALAIGGCAMNPPGGDDSSPGRSLDADNDGVTDGNDDCAGTPAGAGVDEQGCASSQLDSDGDSVADDVDACPDTPAGTVVDATGCAEDTVPPIEDTDGDNVADADDRCPNTPAGAAVDNEGCSADQRDIDGDSVANAIDRCPNTPAGATVDDEGCSASQRDTDGDGVADSLDRCEGTPAGTEVDGAGCTEGQLDQDDDGDGVQNSVDTCPGTPAGETVDSDGCSDGQRDTDGDGVVDSADRCDNTPAGVAVDANGCRVIGGGGGTDPVCGNGTMEGDEQCDPPDGQTCDDQCQPIITAGVDIDADACADAVAINGEGNFSFRNADATTDGLDNTLCVEPDPFEPPFLGQIEHDVWACWTAPCSSTVFASTCGLTGVDTKVAVYVGCDCPGTDQAIVSCNDDGCGAGTLSSRLSFEAVAGQEYLVRIGTFPGADTTPGAGAVSLSCGTNNCPAEGACFSAHGSRGCDDESCCEKTCLFDPFCCNVEWDQECATLASGLCGNFGVCDQLSTIACDEAQAENSRNAGCNDEQCCNDVCAQDPFCCLREWDKLCVDRAAGNCGFSCGAGSGSCSAANGTAGCETESCCETVCARDPDCCLVEWDSLCVEQAAQYCR